MRSQVLQQWQDDLKELEHISYSLQSNSKSYKITHKKVKNAEKKALYDLIDDLKVLGHFLRFPQKFIDEKLAIYQGKGRKHANNDLKLFHPELFAKKPKKNTLTRFERRVKQRQERRLECQLSQKQLERRNYKKVLFK